MRQGPETGRIVRAAARCLLAVLVAAVVCTSATLAPAAPKAKTYPTPEDAVESFVGAVRDGDVKTMVAIFGRGSERLFDSEDPVADQKSRERFLEMYDAKHELAEDGENSRVLVVGADDWPFPIPLVRSRKGWVFDTEVGIEEIIDRRIGRNELKTIQTCLAIADAQREYFWQDRDGDEILEYAQAFRSTDGQQNGLFWPVAEGEPKSPLGELVAAAASEGYASAVSPYFGYHYRLLSGQGASARGGAYDYKVRDDQIGGFAILAFPAAYGDTGIMSFLVNHEGVVYQRDLGKSTETEALKVTTFDPVEGWTQVPDGDLAPLPED